MTFTFTLGDLIQVVVTAATAIAIYTRIVERLTRLEVKVDHLWTRKTREGS